MILVLADKHDPHADVVCDKLLKLNQQLFRLNLDVESLKRTLITFQDDEWAISNSMATIHSSEVSAVWCRRAFVELLLEEEFDTKAVRKNKLYDKVLIC
jgi:hypothetical protein